MTFQAKIAYAARSILRPRYYANDHSRDRLEVEHHVMPICDARTFCPSVNVEGFALTPHRSTVSDFTNRDDVANIYTAEIIECVKSISGADAVLVTATGILRFSEKSNRAGTLNNSMPARFVHIDITDATAAAFTKGAAPKGKLIKRHAHYNIWRAISEPPQDVPLALCDARSLDPRDLIVADAVFDEAGKSEWSFESWVVAHNPAHRWHWFSNMNRDEAIIFKTNDSERAVAGCVAHVAFDDPRCAAASHPRASIEMRATAYWYG